MSKKVMQISFSGGRTSGFMTKWLLDNKSDEYDFIVTFANTGLEDERTLDFVNNCDKYFGFNTVWLEADVKHGERKGTQFKVVTYESASRNGEPFEEVIKKYGIPNPSFLHCTRELKLAPMNSYMKSIGYPVNRIPTAIGIRCDETRRVRKDAENVNIVYPLIDMIPTDKQDVLDWWAEQAFDLGIEEWDGNCKGCFKKSFKKIFKQLDRDKSVLDFHKKMESLYATNGTNKEEGYKRVFFRGHTSANRLYEMWEENKDQPERTLLNMDENSGCSESCEVYLTE
ncbi:MAG: hypothetical protein LC100_15040 [Chitinophagales bacterium]|nr:hypothetical protein [Chitinophagales bacterium]